MIKKVAVACDHGGVVLKDYLKQSITNVEWVDLGTDGTDSVDYPDYGYKLANVVSSGKADLGVAICGSGIGISIACNRYKEARAALCTDTTMSRLSREHNNANIVCIGARLTGDVLAKEIVETFIATEFKGGRHEVRVNKLTNF